MVRSSYWNRQNLELFIVHFKIYDNAQVVQGISSSAKMMFFG